MLSKLGAFRKRFTCPSSEMLCAYRADVLSPAQCRGIAYHLADCDFCDAEFWLLSRHPPRDEPSSTAELPPHVRCLAESLLQPDYFAWERWIEQAFFCEPSLSDA